MKTETNINRDPMVSFRMPKPEVDSMRGVCVKLKQKPSHFIREAVRSALKVAKYKLDKRK
ncbi:MAG: hypothetical protein IT464_12840 [Planctomycetes bacterium]|nr:hypothetical protein [Planctomycetota bacterium]